MTQPNHKGGNMIFDGNNTNEPTVYAVGLLRDWQGTVHGIEFCRPAIAAERAK